MHSEWSVHPRSGVALVSGRSREGVFLMLQAFFDDSGTHRASPCVTWGGLVGSVDQFDRLDEAWREKLLSPLQGKSPLSKFGVADCAHAVGEFRDYKPAERDSLRYDMRTIIEDAGLSPIAFSIPVTLYNRLVKGRARVTLGPPDSQAFFACASHALKQAKRANLSLACVFDKGQKKHMTDMALKAASQMALGLNVPVSYTYQDVGSSTGLQAADIIATEFNWYTKAFFKEADAAPSPHFRSLLNKSGGHSWIMDEAGIKWMLNDFRSKFPVRNWLKSRRFREKGWPVDI